MRLHREELATIVILLFAAVSLFILYVCMTQSSYGQYSDFAKEGDKVIVEGLALSKEMTYSGGHYIIIVKSGDNIVKAFIPSSCDNFESIKKLSAGDRIRIEGTIKIYKSEKEVVAEKII